MTDIIRSLQNKQNLFFTEGASETEIVRAENKLGLKFSSEYCDYLAKFGVATIQGHEFTGICNSNRLSVVDVTLNERNKYSEIPLDWYVIERTNIDGIVVWQATNGTIFQSAPNQRVNKLCGSFTEYIEM